MMDVCSMLVCSMCTAVKIAGSTGTIDARLRPMSKSFIGCVLEVTKDEREQRAPSVFVEFRKCSPCGNSQCSIELIKSGESSYLVQRVRPPRNLLCQFGVVGGLFPAEGRRAVTASPSTAILASYHDSTIADEHRAEGIRFTPTMNAEASTNSTSSIAERISNYSSFQ